MDAISFEEARDIVLSHLPRTAVETVELLEGLGKVLARGVAADRDHPSEDRALRDGWAVSSADLRKASDEEPVFLQTAGSIAAGDVPDLSVKTGNCVSIHTGALLPKGADAVVPLEEVKEEGDRVVLFAPVARFAHVRRRGEYFRKGDVLARAGRVIRPEEIQAIASSGNPQVETISPPRVAVISTGSELVDVGESAGTGQLWASNLYYIAAYVRGASGKPRILGIVPDNPEAIEKAVGEADAEMVVTTGGTAGGARDYIHRVLANLGAEIRFRRVAMSPGRSFTFATLEERAIFCFPGSPGASRTLAWLFLCPAIRKVAGMTSWEPLELVAVLEEDITTRRGLTRFLPSRVSRHAEGLKVLPLEVTERDLYVPSPEINALLVIPQDVDFLKSGYEVRVIQIGEVEPDPEEVL